MYLGLSRRFHGLDRSLISVRRLSLFRSLPAVGCVDSSCTLSLPTYCASAAHIFTDWPLYFRPAYRPCCFVTPSRVASTHSATSFRMIVTKEHGTPEGSHVQSADDMLNDNVLRDDPSSLPPPYASASSSAPQPPVGPASMPDLLANQGLSRVQPPIAHCNNVAIKRATGKVSGSYVVSLY